MKGHTVLIASKSSRLTLDQNKKRVRETPSSAKHDAGKLASNSSIDARSFLAMAGRDAQCASMS
jgi:hypothetical protein